MKNIVLLTLGLLMNCLSFGQTATTKSDSVTIPERWFRAATVDLQRYDDCKAEVNVLKSSNENLRKYNDKLSNFNDDLQLRNAELDGRIKDVKKANNAVVAGYEKDLKQARQQLKRQRFGSTVKTIGAVAGGVAVGMLIMIIAN